MGESLHSTQLSGRATIEPPRRAVLLRRLMIRCPATGLSADTGLDVSSVPSIVSSEQLLIDCPECGQDHYWLADEAYLE